jgi:hypothetical protein
MSYTHNGITYSTEDEYARVIVLFLKYDIHDYGFRLAGGGLIDWPSGVRVNGRMYHHMRGVIMGVHAHARRVTAQ